MLSGGHRREELASSTFCPQRNNVRMVSPASSVSCSSDHQKIEDTVECSLLPSSPLTQSQLLTRASNSFVQWSHGQQALLIQQHSNPDLSFSESNCQRHLSKSPNYAVHSSDDNKLRERTPLMLQLTTANHRNEPLPLLHQSKTTFPTLETSVSSSSSITMTSGSKQYPSDDQILEIIEKKLEIYRAQMKVLKESSSLVKDSLNAEPTSNCSPQGPAPGTSTPKAPDGCILKDGRENEASGCSRYRPEQSAMKNNGTATAKQPTEYVGIMQEAAVICAKKEGESQVVLQALGSLLTVDELVKQSPTLTQHYKLSKGEYKSTWRNVDRSDLSKSTSTLSALETSDRETCPVADNTRDSRPQSSANGEDVRTCLSQNSNLNLITEFNHKSLSSGENGKMEHKRQEFMAETQSEVQTWVGEKGVLQRMFDRLKNLDYEDITDDEETNVTLQMPTLNASSQNRDICEDHLQVQANGHLAHSSTPFGCNENYEGLVTGCASIQVETSRPPEQNFTFQRNDFTNAKTEPVVMLSPKPQLKCICPYFVQNDDDEMELRPCPTCVQNESLNREEFSPRQERGPEDCEDSGLASGCSRRKTVVDPLCEEDEWIVVPLIASDVKLEQVIIISDDDDDGFENGSSVGCIKQSNQSSVSGFQKIQEFDTIFTFANQYNCRVPPEALSQHLPASCTLPKLKAVEKSVSKPIYESASAPGTEAEDSCDTDDSSNYPLATSPNCLTASSRVRAPSSPSSSDSEDKGEVPQPPETIMPRPSPESTSSINNFFPVMSADENGDSINYELHDTTVAATVTQSFSEEISPIRLKSMKHDKRRTKRFKSFVNSDSDKLNKTSNLIHTGNSPELDEASTLPNQVAVKPGCAQPRPAQSGKNSSVSSKVSKGRSPPKTSSDHNRKDEGKRKKSSPNTAQKRPDNGSVNQNSNTNAPETRKRKFATSQLSQPLPGQRIRIQSNTVPSTKASVSAISRVTSLSLNGEKDQALSLPGGHKQSQPQTSLSSKSNQVNSYSTANSTPAKQRLVAQWEEQHVRNQKRRRSSNERDASARNTIGKTANGDHEMTQRNNSIKQLMKKSKTEARQLTQQHTYRQAPTELNPDNTFNGYKWAYKQTTTSNDLDWERERDSPDLPKGLKEY